MTGGSATLAPVASLHGVSAFYGEVVGLSRVDLELSPGITGIIGPNGSGKSTLMRVLTGLLRPSEGALRVLGGDPFADPLVRERIAFVPATECFHDGLSGRRNLEIAFVSRGATRAESRAMAESALHTIGLVKDGNRVYRTWSRGMRQRLKLGVALTVPAELVLLDEPFLGVDPPTRRDLRDRILAMGGDGRAVLVSSHVLHEIESLTDRVGVLARGRLLGFGNVESILRELRDRHPHRIRVGVDEPRRLAEELLKLPHVTEVRLDGTARLEFVSVEPEAAYRELAGAIVRAGALVREVETLDRTLEAVFTHVTASGTRRL